MYWPYGNNQIMAITQKVAHLTQPVCVPGYDVPYCALSNNRLKFLCEQNFSERNFGENIWGKKNLLTKSMHCSPALYVI